MTSDEVMGGSTTFTMLSTTRKFREENPEIYQAVLRALGARQVSVLCIGPAIEGAAARDLVTAVEGLPEAPKVRLVLAGGPDLSIFQELIDESRLYYLSQAPPAPRELDALLRTAVRRAGEAEVEEERRTMSGSLLVELLRRLALLEDPEEIADLVGRTAQLEFRMVDDQSTLFRDTFTQSPPPPDSGITFTAATTRSFSSRLNNSAGSLRS